MASVASPVVPLADNFLVPNATFLVELIAFAIIVFVMWRYIIPPINRAMTARQDAIRKEFAEADQARENAEAAEREFKAQIADARHAAAKIREEAREQGAAIIAEAREQAQVEAARIVEHGHTQLAAERQQTVTTLRSEVGSLATELAGRIVGESLEDDERSNRVVDRFLADLETLETVQGRRPDERGRLMVRGASAEALADLREELGSTRTLADAATLGEELFGVARVLRDEPALRRVLTDSAVEGEAKVGLVESVFGSALGATSVERAQGGRAATLDVLARPGRRARAPRCPRARALGGQGRRPGERRAVRRASAGRLEPGAAHRAVRPRPVGPGPHRACSPGCWATRRSRPRTGWWSRRSPARTPRSTPRCAATRTSRQEPAARRWPRCAPRSELSKADEQRLAARARQAVRHHGPPPRRGRARPRRRAARRDRRRRHRRQRRQPPGRRPTQDRRLVTTQTTDRPTDSGKRQGT